MSTPPPSSTSAPSDRAPAPATNIVVVEDSEQDTSKQASGTTPGNSRKSIATFFDRPKSFSEKLQDRLEESGGDDWTEVDHADAKDRMSALLCGTVRSWTQDGVMKHKCVVCGAEMTNTKVGIVRPLAHVLGLPMNGASVSACEKRLNEVLRRGLQVFGQVVDKRIPHAVVNITREQRVYIIEQLRRAVDKCQARGWVPPVDTDIINEVRTPGGLFDLKGDDANDVLDDHIVEFAAWNDLSVNAISGRGPGSLHAVLVAARRVDAKDWPKTIDRKRFGSSKGELTRVMKREVERATTDFTDQVEAMKDLGVGFSLCVDAMSKNDRCTNNSVVCSARGDMVVGSTWTENQAKSIPWHVADLKKCLDAVGWDAVSFIVTDGEQACKAAAEQICAEEEEYEPSPGVTRTRLKYPKILPQRCATHGYSLLLKDLTGVKTINVRWLERTFVLVTEVNEFMRMHTFAKRARDKHAKEEKVRKLLRFVDSRYASFFYLVERFEENWSVIEKALVDIVNDRTACGPLFREKAREYKTWMCSPGFRNAVDASIVVLKPIVKAMRLTDVKRPNLSFVVENFFKARKDTLSTLQAAFEKMSAADARATGTIRPGRAMTKYMLAEIEEWFDKRQRDIVSEWAWAADALSAPRHFTAEADDDVNFASRRRDAVSTVLLRQFPADSPEYKAAVREYDEFLAKTDVRLSTGFFAEMSPSERFPVCTKPEDVTKERLIQNDSYWTYRRQRGSALADVAMRLGHGFAGQGSAERVNKAVSRIYTKVRNRMDAILTDAWLKIKYWVARRRKRASDSSKALFSPKAPVRRTHVEEYESDSEEEEAPNTDHPDEPLPHNIRITMENGSERVLRPLALQDLSFFDAVNALYEPVPGNTRFGELYGTRVQFWNGLLGTVIDEATPAGGDYPPRTAMADAPTPDGAGERPMDVEAQTAVASTPTPVALIDQTPGQSHGTPEPELRSPVVAETTREQLSALVDALGEADGRPAPVNGPSAPTDATATQLVREGADRCKLCVSRGDEKCAHARKTERSDDRVTRASKRSRRDAPN